MPHPNPRNITDPRVARLGRDIPVVFEQGLNIAAYSSNVFTSVGIQVTYVSLYRPKLREFNNHKQIFDNHNDPESLPELSKIFTIMKLLDQMPTRLSEMLGYRRLRCPMLSKMNLPQLFRYHRCIRT